MSDRFLDIVTTALDVCGFRGRGFRVGKGFALVLDDKHTVNVVPGPGEERARVFSFVGTTPHLPPGIASTSGAGAASAADAGSPSSAAAEWRSHHEDQGGVAWSVSYEPASGLVLLSTDAALATLDTATLSGWLETFFLKVRELHERLDEGWRDGESIFPRRDVSSFGFPLHA